jgi:hypothetical protein
MDDDLLEQVAQEVTDSLINDEDFQNHLKLKALDPLSIQSFISDHIEQVLEVPVSNLVNSKIEDYIEVNDHSFDWEYDDDQD